MDFSSISIEDFRNLNIKKDNMIVQASIIDGSDSLVPFPIGMGYSYFSDEIQSLGNIVRKGNHENLVLCSISSHTDKIRRGNKKVNRENILSTLRKNGINNNILHPIAYFMCLPDYKFVISPEGNGIDCHRHYEALLAGCIPIVENNDHIKHKYRGCPILYTDDYSEISEEYLLEKYEEMKNKKWDYSLLFLESYDEVTQEVIKTYGNYWTDKLLGKKWYK